MIKRMVKCMAFLRQAKTPQEIKMIGVAAVRDAYNSLAEDYNKILDYKYIFCHKCGDFLAADTFYADDRFATGKFPICKKCIMKMVEQRKDNRSEPNETKESVQRVLQLMDLPYIDSFYEDCIKGAYDEAKEKNRTSPFATYNTAVRSLPQYKGMKWKDSEFDEDHIDDTDEINENSRILKQAKKRFGKNYNSADLVFLENEYQDWIKRYACDTKAQEVLFKRICCKELEIDKAQKANRDTKEMDKTLQDLMGSLQVKPNQSNSNALTEAKTFGQLIQRWEDEYDGGKPIPEPDDDFKDVDKIGLYLDVFFKGHLSKMMDLKNGFSRLYDRFMKKYTVTKPQYNEDVGSEELFDQIFGTKIDDA